AAFTPKDTTAIATAPAITDLIINNNLFFITEHTRDIWQFKMTRLPLITRSIQIIFSYFRAGYLSTEY
ncbi:hypothetical protein, partial [Escherichia coli]|uniref:hypothetical protein n=1 Tax=Escherichia coli TaxID=562 RepID=UPI0025789EB1